MSPYRKLIVAVVGLAVMLLHRHLGIDLAAQEAVLVDLVVAGLTAAGIYGFRNEPLPDDPAR